MSVIEPIVFLDNLAHRLFQPDHVKKHNPPDPENHAAANIESLFGINDQTAAVFHQKLANYFYIPNAHVGVNAQLDQQFPYHCQLKSAVVHHELSENLDYDVYWLAAIGLCSNPAVNQPEPSPKPDSVCCCLTTNSIKPFSGKLAIEYSR